MGNILTFVKKRGYISRGIMDLSKRLSTEDKLALIITLSFLIFLVYFGAEYHTAFNSGTAESDGYVFSSEELLGGNLPRSYHPLFYPILSAAITPLVGDVFTASKIVSSFSAALFVLLIYLAGAFCFDKKVGLFALILSVLNFNVIYSGVQAETDILFSALALLTVLCVIHFNKKHELKYVVLAALFFSLSYFTRYAALAILPTIVIGFLYLPSLSLRRRIRHLIHFMVLVLVFLSPHFIINTELYGNPFFLSPIRT